MKRYFSLVRVFLILISLLFFFQCEKKELPVDAKFAASKKEIVAGDSVIFLDLSSNHPIAWTWYFGDGFVSTEHLPQHTYPYPGTYTIKLVVSNAVSTDSITYTNYVKVNAEPYINGSLTDPRDNKTYPTVQIGKQEWMARNLEYLPKVHRPGDGSAVEARYYVYGYNDTVASIAANTTNFKRYGTLYNWYAAMGGAQGTDANPSGIQGVCPNGWHLPSDAEWIELERYLGMSDADAHSMDSLRGTDQGGMLKDAGLTYWESPNTDGSNSTGLTMLPSGIRGTNGNFYLLGRECFLWTTSVENNDNIFYRQLSYNSAHLKRNSLNKEYGFCVRCLKDK